MTDIEFYSKYNAIINDLSERRLKPAFDKLKGLISESKQLSFLDEWRNLDETYHYMLKYTVEGTHDPERQKVYRKLIISTFELADKVLDAGLLRFSSSLEYEKRRSFNSQINFSTFLTELENYELNDNLDDLLEDVKVKYNEHNDEIELHYKIEELFYFIWFRNKLKTDEKAFLIDYLQNSLIASHYRAFIVTSLMMSLLRHFDESKFTLLFDAYENEEFEISQRAITALSIAIFKYDSRLRYYPSITSRLSILNEKPLFRRNIEVVLIQLIRSRETEKIQKKIRDEIMPEMVKISPTLNDKINLDSLMNDIDEDKNPEWEKIFEDSPGLINKMEEITNMQMEGADIFMTPFSMLKMFPFFNELSNWFIPFFASNPAIETIAANADEMDARFIKIIDEAPILCNSDKYSFCFSLQNLPEENRQMMAEGMKAEMDMLGELNSQDELTDPGKKAALISNRFIQDLYRFYRLHPRKNDFEDIFSWRFDFHNKHILSEILKEDNTILRNISEFYFSKDYYEEAAEVFSYLLGIEKNGELYQKLGYCYQRMNNYEKALETYKKAELYELNKKWNLNKIALCYRNLKQPQKALEYYRLAENLDEENLTVELNIGHCLLELCEYEEALKCYFKVEYLKPGNKKVWRPIGWCSFVIGKKEQAEKYFQKLTDSEPNKHDLMNMGHVQWSMGKRKEALEFYKKSIAQTDFTEAQFFEVFQEDLPYLLEQGINKDDVPIMLDQLRCFVEE